MSINDMKISGQYWANQSISVDVCHELPRRMGDHPCVNILINTQRNSITIHFDDENNNRKEHIIEASLEILARELYKLERK